MHQMFIRSIAIAKSNRAVSLPPPPYVKAVGSKGGHRDVHSHTYISCWNEHIDMLSICRFAMNGGIEGSSSSPRS